MLAIAFASAPMIATATMPAPPDEFGVSRDGYYPPLMVCREPPRIPAKDECGGANRELCGLADRVGEVGAVGSEGEEPRHKFLAHVVTALRRKGLWMTARHAAALLQAREADPSLALPMSTFPYRFSSDLSFAIGMASQCAEESIEATLQDAAQTAVLEQRDKTGLVTAVQLAYTRARIGQNKAASQLAVELSEPVLALPETSQTYRTARRTLAMTMAELGDIERAIELLPRNDPNPLDGHIAQIAAYHGQFDKAIELAGTGPPLKAVCFGSVL